MNNAFVFYKDYFDQIKLMEDSNPELVKDILNRGTEKAQAKAKEQMIKVRKAMKIDY